MCRGYRRIARILGLFLEELRPLGEKEREKMSYARSLIHSLTWTFFSSYTHLQRFSNTQTVCTYSLRRPGLYWEFTLVYLFYYSFVCYDMLLRGSWVCPLLKRVWGDAVIKARVKKVREALSTTTSWFSRRLWCLVVGVYHAPSICASTSTRRRLEVDNPVEADARLERGPS